MELNPHDLLKIKSSQDLISYSPVPDWVFKSLRKAPYVVVRRAPLMREMAPIGIRGEARNQRFAAFLPYGKIIEKITPEQLVERPLWERNERIHSIEVLRSLPYVCHILSQYTVAWGPTGSVGFELASSVPTAKPTSDLDLVIRTPMLLPMETAQQIVKELNNVAVRVDVQLETPKGAISLLEYSHGNGPILLRTENGPQLVKTHEIWKV